MIRVLGQIYGNPAVPGTQIVALTVMMGETVIVFQAIFQHQLGAFLRRFPPWSYNASCWLAILEVFDQAVAL